MGRLYFNWMDLRRIFCFEILFTCWLWLSFTPIFLFVTLNRLLVYMCTFLFWISLGSTLEFTCMTAEQSNSEEIFCFSNMERAGGYQYIITQFQPIPQFQPIQYSKVKLLNQRCASKTYFIISSFENDPAIWQFYRGSFIEAVWSKWGLL